MIHIDHEGVALRFFTIPDRNGSASSGDVFKEK